MNFQQDTYFSLLLQCRLPSAIDYLRQFPDQRALVNRYESIFIREEYPSFGLPAELEHILLCYQKFYRAVFYQLTSPEAAEEQLYQRLASLFPETSPNADLDTLEDQYITQAFRDRGYHFLGGRSGGIRGPFVWTTTEAHTYDVELPECIQSYTVRFHDGFLTIGWLDYISLGQISPGGWTNSRGGINCNRRSYALDSENFLVSLLKHEAQHVMDLERYPEMTGAELEYRAKLVELIYSKERNMLHQFCIEADDTDPSNPHAMASHRIAAAFSERLHIAPENVPPALIRSTALELFRESTPKC